MRTGLSVADAMTQSPIHIHLTASLAECAADMARKHVGAMLIKEGGELKGLITEQDIVRKGVAEGLDHAETPVSAIMETNMVTIGPDADVHEALMKMRDRNIRHLPVMDGKTFIGLLTLKDILKIQPQLFELLVDQFELREEARKPVNRNIPGEGICELCGNYAQKLIKNSDGAMSCDKCK